MVCSPRYKISPIAAMAERNPEAVADSPLIWPRTPLGIQRPNTSFVLIEQNARAMEKMVRENKMDHPALTAGSNRAESPMAVTASACTIQPTTKTCLRWRIRFTQLEITSCGSMEPDSLMGTSIAMMAPGEPRDVRIHVSTVLGFMSTSPNLVQVCAAIMAIALFFCCEFSRCEFRNGTWEILVKISLGATLQL